MSYGFIITRYVNSEKTNRYWNQSVKLIRTYYPYRQIVIIDDNSNYDFVNSDHEYKNISIVQSEFPGRGELLPFIYYLKYKWFANAVIIHDSLFIHNRIPFEQFKLPIIPLWHSDYDKENLQNLLRISKYLKKNSLLNKILNGNEINILGINNKYSLCFGVQCYINLHFLENIEIKYSISNLVNAVHCRADRCALERIFGIIFTIEYPKLHNMPSFFGNIHKTKNAFTYNYDSYIGDLQENKLSHKFVKVWTGR